MRILKTIALLSTLLFCTVSGAAEKSLPIPPPQQVDNYYDVFAANLTATAISGRNYVSATTHFNDLPSDLQSGYDQTLIEAVAMRKRNLEIEYFGVDLDNDNGKMKSRLFCGQIFAFSAMDGATDWLDGMVCRINGRSLELQLPVSGGALIFDEAPDGIYGDCLTAGATRAAFADAHHIVIDGDFATSTIPSAYKIETRNNKTVIAPAKHFNSSWFDVDFEEIFAARKKWLDTHYVGDNPVLRRALSQLKNQLCSPQGDIHYRWTTPDRWPHRNMWLWDSVFHALALRHVDIDFAKDAIRAVFACQDEKGFIPHFATPDGRSNTTQPPVLGYGVSKIFEIDHDRRFLAEVYPKNRQFLDWCAANRDRDGDGLLEYFVDSRPSCRCGESGMDNSSRFDNSALLDAPDFNAFYARECLLMAQFAEELRLLDEAAMWRTRAARINRLMNEKLWDDEAGLYLDFDIENNCRSRILSSAGFLPLISGSPDANKVKKMVALLRDPAKFGTALPIPSIARDDDSFSTDMWRGPVWININFMIAEALKNYGETVLADEIEQKSCAVIEKYFRQYGTFFEYYDADDVTPPPLLARKGYNSPEEVFHQPLRDYGWTATLYLDNQLSRKRNN